MTSLTVLPPFTGKTYDDLLADVAARIAEEPARLDMRWWVLMKDGSRWVAPRGLYTISTPACGTVACVGGWMDIRLGSTIHGMLVCDVLDVGSISATAWGSLFDSAVFNKKGDYVLVYDEQYVPIVLARLAAFRRTHAKSLKTPLPTPSELTTETP